MKTSTTSILPLRAGTYTLDQRHSGVYFRVRHLGLSFVRGRFERFDASLLVGGSLRDIAVRATIDLASIATNEPARDAHLHASESFHAHTHPAMTFNSTSIHRIGALRYLMDGLLTVRGVTKAVRLQTSFHGMEAHPGDDRVRVGFTAIGAIRRSDYGIDFNAPVGTSTLMIGETVRVAIDARFLPPRNGN